MAAFTPDPTFYPSPRMAMQAPPEQLAYVAVIDPDFNNNGSRRPDALVVIDVNPQSPSYSQVVGRLDMPNIGDELHHFGWNACSAALCPTMPHPHLERRFLLLPGLRSSRVYVDADSAAPLADGGCPGCASAHDAYGGRACRSYDDSRRARECASRRAGGCSAPYCGNVPGNGVGRRSSL